MVRFVPVSKEEREEINKTGKTPESVLRLTGGCEVKTPELIQKIEEERKQEGQERLNLKSIIYESYMSGIYTVVETIGMSEKEREFHYNRGYSNLLKRLEKEGYL